MADIALLKAEIKSWERQFRNAHGRDPSVQEIKHQPEIAEKYKLYKKLSKSASSSQPAAGPQPSTPPRYHPRQPAPSSIVPRTKALKVDAPLLTTNPFSPHKKRGGQSAKLSNPSQRVHEDARTNPFATPSKAKAKPHVSHRDPSPDPFPLIQSGISFSAAPQPSTPRNPVSRARKRLRGEPVSPSPVKEKRARVSPRSTLALPKHSSLFDSGEDICDGDDLAEAHSSIIDDSPVKPPTGRKSFKLLFDEAIPANEAKRPLKTTNSRSQSAAKPAPGPFGERRGKSRRLSLSSDDMEWDTQPKLKALPLDLPNAKDLRHKKTGNGNFGLPVLPTKDNLKSAAGPSQIFPPTNMMKHASLSASRSPRKHSLPDDIMEADAQPDTNKLIYLPLLPPSPPPVDPYKPSGSKYASNGKGKSKPAATSRKKMKLLEELGEDEDDSVEDEGMDVKVLDWKWDSRRRTQPQDAGSEQGFADESDIDWDASRRPPRQDEPLILAPIDRGMFEVNLPEDLRRVLAISEDESKQRESEKVVRGLLYGVRETHYDPVKGGDIWDVGEVTDGDGAGGMDGEDDWEGEPVPWEVGEL